MNIYKWEGQLLSYDTIAVDSETTNIVDGEVPDIVIAQATGNGEDSFIVERADVLDFLRMHFKCQWIMHNAPFDIFVLKKYVNNAKFDSIINEKIESNEIWDTGISYRLLSLAKYGKVPQRWAMDVIVKELFGEVVDKNDDTRMGWQLDMTFDSMGDGRRYYAALDAIWTWKMWDVLKVIKDYDNAMSHQIQLKGAMMLHYIMLNGLGFDLCRKEAFLTSLKEVMESQLTQLKEYGWGPGVKGNTKVLQDLLHEVEREHDLKLPRTDTANKENKKGKLNPDKISTSADDLEEIYNYHPFFKLYIDYKKNEKTANFFNEMSSGRLYPRYNSLLETGRTSSYSFNVQNLPSKQGVRECFIPSEGYCIGSFDFSALEICTLAQVCYSRFGYSKFKELLNEGRDIHKYCASMIYNIPEESVDKDKRKLAKILSFGFAGGMCPKTFVSYAKAGYGVVLTEEEAENLQKAWKEAFPEMVEYLRDPLLEMYPWQYGPYKSVELNLGVFKRVVRGNTETTTGNPYPPKIAQWVYNDALPKVNPYYATKAVYGEDCHKALMTTEVTLSGRVARNRGYCQGKNYHFQGLAADIAKVAGYDLMVAGYKLIAFIHDEFLIELPIGDNLKEVNDNICSIMVNAANKLSPDVKYSVEGALMTRWSKKAETVIQDEKYLPMEVK